MPETFFDWLRIADTVALALVAIRLAISGLFRVYTALFLHASSETALALFSFTLSTQSVTYARFYIAFAVMRWVLWGAIVWGLYRDTLGATRSYLVVGRSLVAVAFTLALLPILFTLNIDFSHVGPEVRLLPAMFLGARTVTSALATLTLLLCAFLAWVPVPTKRNCAYLCLGFGVIFVTHSAAYSLRNALGPEVMRGLNIGDTICSTVIFLSWAALLNKAGEESKTFIGPRKPPTDLGGGMGQLTELGGQLK